MDIKYGNSNDTIFKYYVYMPYRVTDYTMFYNITYCVLIN